MLCIYLAVSALSCRVWELLSQRASSVLAAHPDCACVLSGFSGVQLPVTVWTVAACSSAPGILQARILEWGAMPFSRRFSQPRDQTHVLQVDSLYPLSSLGTMTTSQ